MMLTVLLMMMRMMRMMMNVGCVTPLVCHGDIGMHIYTWSSTVETCGYCSPDCDRVCKVVILNEATYLCAARRVIALGVVPTTT